MVRLIIWVVVAIFVLSFFGISLQNLIENPTTQNNFSFFVSLLEEGWNNLVAWLNAIISPIVEPIAAFF